MKRLPDKGTPSSRFAHLGVWVFCLGPNSPLPGERLQVGIIDEKGEVIRRFEQIRGDCIDEGYVDFFGSSKCRPSVHMYPLVDVTSDGKQTVYCNDFTQSMGKEEFFRILGLWANKHGKSEYAIMETK